MSLTQYYAAPSLDGFIADADNSLDWLLTRTTDEDGPLSFRDFMAGVGAMAMGTTTYEWILDQEPPDDTLEGWTWPPRCPAGSSPTGTCRASPAPRSSSPARTLPPCTGTWSPPPTAATSGSSAVGTWPVSSPTPGCWTGAIVTTHRAAGGWPGSRRPRQGPRTVPPGHGRAGGRLRPPPGAVPAHRESRS